jgi:hypothetical protein
MRNTCFSYDDERAPLIAEKAEKLKMRRQEMPVRRLSVEE